MANISGRGTLSGADVCTHSSPHEASGSAYLEFFIPIKDSPAWSLHVFRGPKICTLSPEPRIRVHTKAVIYIFNN